MLNIRLNKNISLNYHDKIVQDVKARKEVGRRKPAKSLWQAGTKLRSKGIDKKAVVVTVKNSFIDAQRVLHA